MSRIRIAVGCVALLLAASAAAELRTYDVDFKYQQEVYRALVSILNHDPAVAAPAGLRYGLVQLLPTGQIVVDTSPETHAEIEDLLAAIRARQTDAAPRVTLRYWVVLGTNAAEPPPGDTPPPILNDVLAELSRVHNSLTFRVLGTATLVTESGQEGEVQSQPLGVKQTVYVQGDSATADTELRYVEPRSLALARQDPQLFQTIPDPYAGNIKLKVTLERGEFLVLGENTVQTVRLNGTLFYIAHWPASE